MAMSVLHVLLALGCLQPAVTFFNHQHATLIDSVTLNDVTPEHTRARRSAHQMPDHLHFDFRSGSGSEVKLRLRRSEHIHIGGVPVLTVGDDQKLVKADLPPDTDAAVYRDVDNGAAVVARKNAYGHGPAYTVTGTMSVDDTMVTISPRPVVTSGNVTSEAEVTSSEADHVLHAMPEHDESYGHDYVELDEDESEEASNVVEHTRVKRQLRPISAARALSDAARESRPPTGSYNIKVNIVCDHGCFKDFVKRHPTEKLALEEARLYFAYLAQSIDVRYRTISSIKPGLKITVTPVNIITATSAKGSQFSEDNRVTGDIDGINGNKLLGDFRAWVREAGLPNVSTTLLHTGYNMMTRGDPKRKGQLGIGYRGGGCGKSGVVVVEESFHGISGMIAAHELGHSLNSIHDGSYRADDVTCADDDKRYVMSTYIGVPQGSSNPWSFSPCSTERIVKFITKPRDPACFADDYEKHVPDDAGQVYDADAQCANTNGKGYFFCRGRQADSEGFGGMCTRMYCSKTPDVASSCRSLIPLEYTSCGDQKWCVRGQCFRDFRAPRKQKDSCPQGDQSGYGCRMASCRNPLARNTFCCSTCGPPLPSPSPTSRITTQLTMGRQPLRPTSFQPLSPTPSRGPMIVQNTVDKIFTPPTPTSSRRPSNLPPPQPSSRRPSPPTPTGPAGQGGAGGGSGGGAGELNLFALPRICQYSKQLCIACLKNQEFRKMFTFCRPQQ